MSQILSGESRDKTRREEGARSEFLILFFSDFSSFFFANVIIPLWLDNRQTTKIFPPSTKSWNAASSTAIFRHKKKGGEKSAQDDEVEALDRTANSEECHKNRH